MEIKKWKSENSFGYKHENSQILISFPEELDIECDSNDLININKKNNRKNLRNFFNVLYKKKTNLIKSNKLIHSSDHINNLFVSFEWIINAFLNNGIPKTFNYIFSNNLKNKINWKKTFDSGVYFINKKIVFNKIICKQKNKLDDMITYSFIKCFNIAIENIGWLYNISKKIYIQDNVSNDILLCYLKKELVKTYKIENIHMINHMINILDSKNNGLNENNSVTLLHNEFWNIYENLICKIFSNYKEINPHAKWKNIEGIEKDASNLRPDCIHKDKQNNIWIIDAKYYHSGDGYKGMPQTSDIQKQFIYGEWMKEYINKNNIDNINNIYLCFILPGKNINSIKHISTATMEIFNNNIYAYQIDLQKLINNEYNEISFEYLPIPVQF
ncbi:MAG: hypothetical protein LBD05_02710 [Mycoplasmataceae bacterium]|nr:hypothetical protein [Mycoplasmataceae bacterium]